MYCVFMVTSVFFDNLMPGWNERTKFELHVGSRWRAFFALAEERNSRPSNSKIAFSCSRLCFLQSDPWVERKTEIRSSCRLEVANVFRACHRAQCKAVEFEYCVFMLTSLFFTI